MDPEAEHRLIGALLRIPFQATVARIYEAVAAAGYDDLRPAHFVPFQHLSSDGLHVADLAERAQMTRQSMGYLVDYLEAHGYLARFPDPTDRRAKVVQLTQRGREITQIARMSLNDLEREWGQQLGITRLEQLYTLLDALVGVVEQPAAGAELAASALNSAVLWQAISVNRVSKIIGRTIGDELILGVRNPILAEYGITPPDLAVFVDRGDSAQVPTVADTVLVCDIFATTRDDIRRSKLPLYAAAGFAETWLFDLAAETIERHTAPSDGRYTLIAVAGRGQALDSTVIPGLTIPTSAIPPKG